MPTYISVSLKQFSLFTARSQIAKFMGTTWGPPGPRWTPCWPHKPCYQGSLTMYWYHTTHCVNIFKPEQNGWDFADDILEYFWTNEGYYNSYKIPLKFDPKSLIDNKSFDLSNGLALKRCQAIIWTNDDQVLWCHKASEVTSIVWCLYNAVNFLPNPHKIHPIAHPLGWDMGCILWVQTVIYTLPQSMQWCMWYHVILNRVITALNCTLHWTALYQHSTVRYTGLRFNSTRLY